MNFYGIVIIFTITNDCGICQLNTDGLADKIERYSGVGC